MYKYCNYLYREIIVLQKIKNIIKYGLPIIVFLAMLFIIFFVNDNGDPEFGAIGSANAMMLLLIIAVVLYFVVGIIVWVVKKSNFIFLSALFSVLAILFTIIAMNGIRVAKESLSSEKHRNERLAKQQKEQSTMDSLSTVIQKHPQDYKNIEKRALFYLNRDILHKPASDEYQKYIKDLQLVIAHKTTNLDSYNEVSGYYLFMNDHDKAIKLWNDLKTDVSIGKIILSEADIGIMKMNLKYTEEEKKKYLIALDSERKWLKRQNEIKQEQINALTEKFKNEGYNSKGLAERGLAYKYLKLYKQALSDFDHAIKLDSKNRTAWVQRADVLKDMGRGTEAISAYKDLINRYPDAEKLFQGFIDEIVEISGLY